MNDQDLRDCFALMLTIANEKIDPIQIWEMADALVEARKPKEEAGITAIKRKVKPK